MSDPDNRTLGMQLEKRLSLTPSVEKDCFLSRSASVQEKRFKQNKFGKREVNLCVDLHFWC
jgi:hypothetical protein